MCVELKTQADPVLLYQYQMLWEAREGIKHNIDKLLQLGVLCKCHSAWKTLLLSVENPHTQDYCPMLDLREVNKGV